MSISWDDVVRRLKSRGYRYYNASTGPIEIDWWSGFHGGKNGYWIFISSHTIRRDRNYGDSGVDDECSFSCGESVTRNAYLPAGRCEDVLFLIQYLGLGKNYFLERDTEPDGARC